MDTKLEIYKIAVEMADRVSARRITANGFFLTVNTALTTLLGFMYSKLAVDKRAVLIFVSAVGIIMSGTWFFAIRSYKRLNRVKFQIINEIEKELPYQNFTKEWELLKRQTAEDAQLKGFRNRWLKFKDRYTEITNIEGTVPLAFGTIYVLILVGAVLKVIIR